MNRTMKKEGFNSIKRALHYAKLKGRISGSTAMRDIKIMERRGHLSRAQAAELKALFLQIEF